MVRFFRYPGCSWRYPFIASPLKNLSELYDEQLPDKYKVELDQYFRPSLAINFPFWKADKIIKNSAHHKKQLFHPDSIFIYPGVQIFFSSLKFCLKFLWVELFNWIIFCSSDENFFFVFEERWEFLDFSKFITKAPGHPRKICISLIKIPWKFEKALVSTSFKSRIQNFQTISFTQV